jgi:hypothetical protein
MTSCSMSKATCRYDKVLTVVTIQRDRLRHHTTALIRIRLTTKRLLKREKPEATLGLKAAIAFIYVFCSCPN